MNGTIGRGSKVHATNGSYADCGQGMGRNAVTTTTEPIDCLACLALQPAPAPVVETYEVECLVNTLARGWKPKTFVLKGTEVWVSGQIAELMNNSGIRVLSSAKAAA